MRSVGSAINKPIDVLSRFKSARVLGWPRHNGAPIVTAKEHADEQTEPNLDFGLEPRE
jgi:hypothetical protein